jgi:hypothetical protein
LYVVLSGTTNKTAAVQDACMDSPTSMECSQGLAFVRAAAAMFAISGSYLGLGAVALAFTLVLVVDEHPKGREPAVRDATLLLFSGGSVIALLSLVWGYRDAVRVFNGTSLGVWAFLVKEGALWWALGGVAVGVSAAVALLILGAYATSICRVIFGVALVLYTAGPVYWYLVVQGTAAGGRSTGQSVVAQFMLGWVMTSVGFFTFWLPQLVGFRDRQAFRPSGWHAKWKGPLPPMRAMSKENSTPSAASSDTGGAPNARLISPELDVKVGDVRLRVREQGSKHWHEFSVIVASASILVALVLAWRIIQIRHFGLLFVTSVAIITASGAAVALAYYSIQVGTLLTFGPLRAAQVFASFVIATAQLSLFLWPAHTLGRAGIETPTMLADLRQWLLFFALFAASGALANWHAARIRIREGLERVSRQYESAQLRDRRSAMVAGLVSIICWLVSLRLLTTGLLLGIVISGIGSLVGIASQAQAVSDLSEELERLAG